MTHRFVATTTLGAESVLARELSDLGARDVQADRGAVRFGGPLEAAYRCCYRARTASRILLVLRRFPAPDAKALYGGARTLDWTDHLTDRHTLRVDFVGTSSTIRNARFGALKVKDAIVDSVRDAAGARPSIDLAQPDVRVHVHLSDGTAQLAIDLSGQPLHIRGHGRDGGPAPLKESLAAALLLISGWPAAAAAGKPFVDPLCGSGTLLIEAAEMALGLAAGRARTFGFERWRGHDADAWARVRAEPDQPLASEIVIVGSDRDSAQVQRARGNANRSDVDGVVKVAVRELADVAPPDGPPGHLVTNPPYGERLGSDEEVGKTWALLGDVLRQRFLGYNTWLFAGTPRLGRQLGLKPASRHAIHNGPLDGRLLEVPIASEAPTGSPGWRP